MLQTTLVPPFRFWGRLWCLLLGKHIWCKACRSEAKFHCVRCGKIDQITLNDGSPL